MKPEAATTTEQAMFLSVAQAELIAQAAQAYARETDRDTYAAFEDAARVRHSILSRKDTPKPVVLLFWLIDQLAVKIEAVQRYRSNDPYEKQALHDWRSQRRAVWSLVDYMTGTSAENYNEFDDADSSPTPPASNCNASTW